MELDDIRLRLEALEKSNGRLSQLAAELSDAITITAEVQRRQARVQRSQAEELDALREFALRHQEFVQRHEKMLGEFDLRMKEIGDKLDGLIGYVSGLPKTPPPPAQ